MKRVGEEVESMQEQTAGSWRDLLEELNREEKQSIITALGIQEKTLKRWIEGTTDLPHRQHLQKLVHMLPAQKRARFLEFLRDDPALAKYRQDFSNLNTSGLPPTLYPHVLAAYRDTPEELRFNVLCSLVLFQAVATLDPARLGLNIVVVKCTPPASNTSPVRSFMQCVSLGTPPWNVILAHENIFMGNEFFSEVLLQPLIIPRVGASHSHFFSQDTKTVSTTAFPIQRQKQLAGYVIVRTTQEEFFTARRQKMIEQCCDLFLLAFQENAFYPLRQIALATMPPVENQQSYLHLQSRVAQALLLARSKGMDKTLQEAEEEVCRQSEEELLSTPLSIV